MVREPCWACKVGELDDCECPEDCDCEVCIVARRREKVVIVEWTDAFDKLHQKVAEKVDMLPKGHYLVHWIGGGTTHFAPDDGLKIVADVSKKDGEQQ